DQYIERVTYELRRHRKVRVATSDSLEQLIILGHGAQRISAEHFHEEVMGVSEEIARILKQNNS
ncbi:MAG: NYN domain-containing protein, partial [Oscillospiraceae bacterium]|nr:NYN domain-containing protein [Oscillospiraceae bacterium]